MSKKDFRGWNDTNVNDVYLRGNIKDSSDAREELERRGYFDDDDDDDEYDKDDDNNGGCAGCLFWLVILIGGFIYLFFHYNLCFYKKSFYINGLFKIDEFLKTLGTFDTIRFDFEESSIIKPL